MNNFGVIQVIDSLNAGGAEVLAVNIANSLLEKGINSHLCTTRKEGILKSSLKEKVGYIYLKRKKSIDFSAIFKFRKYLKKNSINIIHAHSTSYFFVFCLKMVYPKVKITWHIHSGNYTKLKGFKFFIIKFFSFFFDRIINVNQELNNWSTKKLKHKHSIKLENFPLFNNLGKKTVLQGIEDKRIVILSSLREVKDHLNLLKAFKFLQPKYPEWTLHFIGKDFKDEYSNKIKQYIVESNLDKSVYLYDLCLDIKNILYQSTIGVLSSKSEGLPISLLEYGLAKLPVVVTNVGECGKVIENGKSGIVVEKENSLELANAIEEYINSEEKKKSYGELHYKNVKANYSKENFIKKLITIYAI
ncbi:glycosyltransferase family 4 protein [Polaribacter sp. Hel1_85]|uniref:glycosyltransferase family 4 protein n=1 Tax=Polaribacter sp. Hel1_85 TaxID=1250005 RepID=UPI00052D7E5E|nr:glycosyltransferase family 4 protein [Polaribacter sp. Hel1_85]KGL63246.1 glycosyltransferase, GT4 family [Polaribacter sp. Hel1_85]